MTQAKISFWFPLAVVFFEVATYLANDMYLPGLPLLREDFQISQSLAQDTLLYWFLGSASMQLLMGPLSDRYGRKIILIFGVLLFSISSIVCAQTTNIFLFLISRFIQGCAVCSVVVAGYSAIHESFDTKIAIKIMSIMSSIVILAPAFGPILGAIVIEFFSWRAIFIVLAIWGIVSLLLLTFAMPNNQREKIPLHLAEIFNDYWKIGTRKSFLIFTMSFCFLFLSLICWVVESPFILIEQYHQSNINYGLIQLYVFGSFMIGAQITGFLVHKARGVTLIKIGTGIAFAGSVAFVTLCYLHMPLYILVMSMMVVGLGIAMTFGPLSRYAIESCQEPMGRRMAIFSSYMSFFGVISTLMVTLIKMDSMLILALMVGGGCAVSFGIMFLCNIPKIETDSSVGHVI